MQLPSLCWVGPVTGDNVSCPQWRRVRGTAQLAEHLEVLAPEGQSLQHLCAKGWGARGHPHCGHPHCGHSLWPLTVVTHCGHTVVTHWSLSDLFSPSFSSQVPAVPGQGAASELPGRI